MGSKGTVEIQLERVYAVSRASSMIPFNVDDASRSEEEVEASQVRGGGGGKRTIPSPAVVAHHYPRVWPGVRFYQCCGLVFPCLMLPRT